MNKIILFILVWLYLSSCSEDYYIKEANRYCSIGELEKAIECYDKALTTNPDNYNVYIDKGITLGDGMANEIEAVKAFSEAINRFPLKADAYYYRAESYMRMEMYKKALNDYNCTLKIVVGNEGFPIRIIGVNNEFFHFDFGSDDSIDPYKVYADRAIAYYYLDSIKPAWIDLNFCISDSRELAQCYYWRAFVYFKLNKTYAACDDLKKSASLGYNEALVDYKKYCNCDTIK